jgi:hypothetical protein
VSTKYLQSIFFLSGVALLAPPSAPSTPGLLLMLWEFLPLALLAGLALLVYITLHLRRKHHQHGGTQ